MPKRAPANRALRPSHHRPKQPSPSNRSKSQQDRGNAMLQLVSALDRLGTESAFEVLARADALHRQGKSIVNLGIGQPDFKTPAHIVEAAIKALRDGHHGYTPAQGIVPLRGRLPRPEAPPWRGGAPGHRGRLAGWEAYHVFLH